MEARKLTEVEEKRIERNYQEFFKVAGEPEDDVTIVLKTHLLAEYYIDQLLILLLPKGHKIIDNMGFSLKVRLLEALEALPEELYAMLNGLNKVRNGCAHEKDYTISSTDLDKIGKSLGKDYIALKNEPEPSKPLLYTILMHLITGLDANIMVREGRTSSYPEASTATN